MGSATRFPLRIVPLLLHRVSAKRENVEALRVFKGLNASRNGIAPTSNNCSVLPRLYTTIMVMMCSGMLNSPPSVSRVRV